LDERAVADDWLAIDLEAHSGCRIRRLKLIARAELRGMFRQPATDEVVLGVSSFLAQGFPGVLLLRSSAKQKNVLHSERPPFGGDKGVHPSVTTKFVTSSHITTNRGVVNRHLKYNAETEPETHLCDRTLAAGR